MPIYDYICKCGVVTEVRRGIEIFVIPCPACGKKAIRDLPRNVGLSGLPTRGSSMPDTPEEQIEAERKDLKREGWDGDRAMEFVRKGVHEDEKGNKQFSPELAKKRGG